MDAEKLMGLAEAAAMIGVDRTTLARAAREGSLKATKIAGSWLVTVVEVRRWKTENHNPNMKRR